MEQFERLRSIEAHDFPKSPESLAGRCSCRAAMAGKVRYQSGRPRNQRLRTRHDDLVRLYFRPDYLVGVLQSRATQGTVWRPRPDGLSAWRNLAFQTRIDVGGVVSGLCDSDSESRFRHLGRRDTRPSRSHSTRNHGCDDSDRMLRLVACPAKRHQRRSPG